MKKPKPIIPNHAEREVLRHTCRTMNLDDLKAMADREMNYGNAIDETICREIITEREKKERA